MKVLWNNIRKGFIAFFSTKVIFDKLTPLSLKKVLHFSRRFCCQILVFHQVLYRSSIIIEVCNFTIISTVLHLLSKVVAQNHKTDILHTQNMVFLIFITPQSFFCFIIVHLIISQ